MAWRNGSLSRSLMSVARTSSLRSGPPLPRILSPPISAPRLTSRRLSFLTRNVSELGCVQSMLPLHTTPRLASHLVADVRAFCELSQGVEKMVDSVRKFFHAKRRALYQEEWKRWVMAEDEVASSKALREYFQYLSSFSKQCLRC